MTHLLAPVTGGRADWAHATPVRTGPLTRRQARVHAARDDFTRTHGYPPTIRELAAAVGLDYRVTWRQLGQITERLGAGET